MRNVMPWDGVAALISIAMVVVSGPVGAQTPPPTRLDEIVVTGQGRSERLSQVASTVQVIDQEQIVNSAASSITDLLAQNGVGFFSEWTPAQTSINIRGGASDGQGRDFRSDVLVLLNGRRAGTANLSKLSLNDVYRIEVIRGPGSVIYGSQAVGGVINVITRNGRNTSGSLLTATTGSWGRLEGAASTAGRIGQWDYYLGGSLAYRDDYEGGSGSAATMENTHYNRRGGLGAAGWAFNDRHRLDVIARSDGTYRAGFRGSSWDTDNQEDRYNASFDATYAGGLADSRVNWTAHLYAFKDTDDFRWGSEVVRNAAGSPAAGYDRDDNTRVLKAQGVKLVPRFNLLDGNDLLAGLDAERSQLRSSRYRVPMPGAAATQTAPFDTNSDDLALGLYAEDVQRLLDDRVALRAGARWTYGQSTTIATPNVSGLRQTTRSFDGWTYSAGATWRAMPWLNLRAGASTGFRAPTASELGQEFTTVQGGQIIGNPDLEPESSRQFEIGFTATHRLGSLDVALFENKIHDRITTQSIGANRTQYINSTGDAVVRGVDVQATLDVARAMGWSWLARLTATGTYNFTMEDKGAAATANARELQRAYRYQGALTGMVGQPGIWDFRLFGILRGPMWYETEEPLLVPQAEPARDYVHRKGAFWTWNARMNYQVMPGVTAWGAVNNIFEVNEGPIFIALNENPCKGDTRLANGGCGNSMPGREFLAGVQWAF